MKLGFEHSYSALPAHFYAGVLPARVAGPRLVVFNRPLAAELGLDASAVEREAAQLFSGNELADDAHPIAMAYAGHQFAHFVPQLGDGRAILLGELKDRGGILRDIQLKGSGRTPFSRGGDGRAAIGPMLREYVISEAMHALGIPTTRSLAVVTTGEEVFRQGAQPGAVLTRVAASHVRVGTFQYFAARNDQDAVRALVDYVIARHDPQARDAEMPALELLKGVAERQAALIANWMRVGFIHGVMNTDNMAVSGETIDYGPCAFMDHYDPNTVFSSIDSRGRYAYGNQPSIAQWNLARLAETLLPLIDPDPERSLTLATAVVEGFMGQFDVHFVGWIRRKIGLAATEEGDADLIRRLFAVMQDAHADFTLTFRALCLAARGGEDEAPLRDLYPGSTLLADWLLEWRARLARDPQSVEERIETMRLASPAFIPRNHRVETALDAATTRGDFAPFHQLLGILQRPYQDQPESAPFTLPPEPSERVLQTFCGT